MSDAQRSSVKVATMNGSTAERTLTGNRILDTLPEDELAQLAPHLEPVMLRLHQVVYEREKRFSHVYFPTGGVLSIIASMKDGSGVEVSTVGREGIGGSEIMLGSDRMANQTVCQVPGSAMRMPLEKFVQLIDEPNVLRHLAQRYVQGLFRFMSQSVACNRLHSVQERCARWLLLTLDRVNGSSFTLTQEYLATMLGVRRASVSVVAATLREAGLIDYHRGKVTVVDRVGLENASCECYRVVTNEFDRLLSLKPDPANRVDVAFPAAASAGNGAVVGASQGGAS